MASQIDDLKDGRVPPCLYWSVEEVSEWIGEIGLPRYKECFSSNCINGQKLVLVDASSLPRLGVNDHEHIKFIAKHIRDLLGLEDPDWNRSISLPPRDTLGMYLEKKCPSGEKADKLTFEKFERHFADAKWQPPLANHCLILPHS